MFTQRNNSKMNYIIVFIVSIIFFYISYILLLILNNIYMQILLILISSYLFVNGMYKYVPNYIYRIIGNEIIFVREFSDRYSDDYKIKFEDIEFFKKSERISFSFWNHFYNMNNKNEIYSIKTNRIEIKINPNEKLIESINSRIKRENNEWLFNKWNKKSGWWEFNIFSYARA